MSRVVNVVSGAYDAVFRPSALISVRQRHQQTRLRGWLNQFRAVFAVYLLNLALYAVPLTLAGFGRQSVPTMPDWFGALLTVANSQAFWEFSYAFFQNSLSILGATLLTLVTFHIGLVLTWQSEGILETSYAVIYSTSVYLAGIFSVVWYLSLNSGVSDARTFVVNVQKAFVYAIIDFFGANLGLPGGRPESMALAGISAEGELILTLLLVLLSYYLYSLYLGARINHDAPRSFSLLAVGLVATSPVIYVGAVVIAYSIPYIPVP